MKEKPKDVGSCKNTATRWGQLVTGSHIASTQDNMLGIDGNRDILVMKAAIFRIQGSLSYAGQEGGFDCRCH
jgi:hypothetical protein